MYLTLCVYTEKADAAMNTVVFPANRIHKANGRARDGRVLFKWQVQIGCRLVRVYTNDQCFMEILFHVDGGKTFCTPFEFVYMVCVLNEEALRYYSPLYSKLRRPISHLNNSCHP